jgi:putative hydrolase of the HAD superfamily
MPPSNLRAVVFDFGGVLWDMRWDVARELDRVHGLPRSSVFETLYRSEAWRDIERGTGDPEAWRHEAHRALEERAGRPLPPLHEEWRKSQAPIGPNVELVMALRSDYKVSILSNADASLRQRLEREIGIHHLFDDIVCSAEVGMAKPEPAVFDLACGRLGLAPAECVFVDDHEPNVKAAQDLGMQGVLFRVDRGDDLRAQLATLGVLSRG